MQNALEIHISLIRLTFSETTYMTFIRANPWKTDPHSPTGLDRTVTKKWHVRQIKKTFANVYKTKCFPDLSVQWNEDNSIEKLSLKKCWWRKPEILESLFFNNALSFAWMNIPLFCFFPCFLTSLKVTIHLVINRTWDNGKLNQWRSSEIKMQDVNTVPQKEHRVTAL